LFIYLFIVERKMVQRLRQIIFNFP